MEQHVCFFNFLKNFKDILTFCVAYLLVDFINYIIALKKTKNPGKLR